ncbi:MAG: recombinase family protein [Candidatus Acidiferrum sp.]|jgi:DNA invertase Pin-like site-specific DNA recombinase
MAIQKLSPSCAPPKTETATKPGSAKRAAIYTRVSCGDQHPETQVYDLRELAKQRGYEILREYTDTISGAKSKRPGLEQLLADAGKHRFDVVLVAAFDRVARNVRHFLEVLDELNHLEIEFVSLRENIDTGGPLGRAMVVIVGAIAELERSLIVERVKAGMRRARLEGRRIGRAPLNVDRAAIVRDRLAGQSLTEVAKKHRVSRATVCRLVNETRTSKKIGVPEIGNQGTVIPPAKESGSQAAA